MLTRINFIVVANFFAVLSLSVAQQYEAIISTAKFSTSRHYTQAVYDGDDNIYILGGRTVYANDNSYTDEIVKFTISTEQLEVVGRFPEATQLFGAVQDTKGDIYCFCAASNGDCNTIWRLTPGGSTLEPIEAGILRQDQSYRNAIFDGEDTIWLIPGYTHSNMTSYAILTQATVNTTTLTITASYRASSVWIGTSGYIFGGRDQDSGEESDGIVKYVPSGNEDAIVILPTKLPYAVAYSSATVVNENAAYIVGGYSPEGIHHLSSYNPNTEEVKSFKVSNFDDNLRGLSSVYVSKLNRIYVFGGFNTGGSGSESDQIRYINLD